MSTAQKPTAPAVEPAPYLWVECVHINATNGYGIGDEPAYQTSYRADELGDLYRAMRREYGRCTGHVYVDGPADMFGHREARPIGWVFIKRRRYEDARDNSPKSTYLHEVWVTVMTGEPIKRVIKNFATFPGK